MKVTGWTETFQMFYEDHATGVKHLVRLFLNDDHGYALKVYENSNGCQGDLFQGFKYVVCFNCVVELRTDSKKMVVTHLEDKCSK